MATKTRKPSRANTFRKPTIGRPSTYEDDYCSRVVACGDEGYSLAEIARDLGTTSGTQLDWAERHPTFAQALRQAREYAMVWWEHQGKKGMWAGKEFNDRVMKFIMTNQFRDHYKERVEVSGALANINFDLMTDEQLARISKGEHPYAVLAPTRELLVAGGPEGEVGKVEVGTTKPPDREDSGGPRRVE